MLHIASQSVHTKKGGEDMKQNPVIVAMIAVVLLSVIALILGLAAWAASEKNAFLVGIIFLGVVTLLIAVISAWASRSTPK